MPNNDDLSQYPLGSNAFPVFDKNVQNLDLAVNSEADSWPDRFGKNRKTWAGMENSFNQFLLDSGYVNIGDYGPGLEITERNQIFWRDGELYRAGAGLELPYATTGDWDAEEGLFVAVGDQALRQQLSSTAGVSGAFLVGFRQGAAGSIGRNVYEKLTDRVSVKDFGAKGDGVTDDSQSIQAAFDSGLPLYVPRGTYLLSLWQTIQLEGGTTFCALKIPSGLSLAGDGAGQTTFKLRDNESTDAYPKYHNLMASNGILENIYIRSITFDMNGQNNLISPDRANGVYSSFNCAAIFVSGTIGAVGTDARMIDSKITECEFLNSPGVTCIATGQQEAPATGSNNVEISYCRFHNNGIDSSDHSSVYMWGDDIKVHNCTFSHPTISTGLAGPVVAAELHGSMNQFTNNTVHNYCQGAWICASENGPVYGMILSNNVLNVSWMGFGLWSIGKLIHGIRGLIISDNYINILEGQIDNPGMNFSKTGLFLSVNAGAATNISATGNVINNMSARPNLGIVISSGPTVDAAIFGAMVSNNVISGFCRGVLVGGSGSSVYGIEVRSNEIRDIARSTGVADIYGVQAQGANGHVNISSNSMLIRYGEEMPYAIILSAGSTFDSLYMSGNHVDRIDITPVLDASTVWGIRSGDQATTFGALPTQSQWKVGDVTYLSTKPVLGVSPDKYVVDGWTRITNGSSNSLNVDWLERRMPTGT